MIWGQIPMRENVPFRDTVRDWYTGLISKRMLGSLELQALLSKLSFRVR